MSKVKRDRKQFSLLSKDDCIIYLQSIIGTAELCIYKLRKYNKQTEEILNECESRQIVNYDIYCEMSDKTANVIGYLLNVLGDAQSVSISYFKYRKQVKRLIDKHVDGVKIISFTAELNDIYVEFNKLRNWYNHIPESLLVSERELINQGVYHKPPTDHIEIYLKSSVEYDYMKALYTVNVDFYKMARKLIQACKKDYSLLIGKDLSLKKVYLDKPVNIKMNYAAYMSADIQGLMGIKLIGKA